MSDIASTPVAQNTLGFRMVRTLGAIAMLSGLLVVLVFQFTKPIIAENQRVAIEQAVFQVVPGATSRSDWVLTDSGLATSGSDGEVIYAAYSGDGELKGVALAAGAQIGRAHV